MVTSAATLAKRAFVTLLLAAARVYGVAVEVTRESRDDIVEKAFKKVCLKAHPDKGGDTASFQELQSARDHWLSVKRKAQNPPPCGQAGTDLLQAQPEAQAGAFAVRSAGILLTYQKTFGLEGWSSFCDWVRKNLKLWKVRYWCATLETCADGTHHAHLMLQFFSAGKRLVSLFWYDGLKPNATTNDLCGAGRSGQKFQQSLDRAFFYVFADKLGTARDAAGKPCVDGNYFPAWTAAVNKYQVLGKWPETLWKQYKLSHEVYEEYLYKARDGVTARKRNLDACQQREVSQAAQAEIEARLTASASADLRPLHSLRINRAQAVSQPLLQQFSGRYTASASSELRPLRGLRFNRAPSASRPLLQRRFSHIAASSLQPCSGRFAASASTELSLLRCLHFDSAPTAPRALQPCSAHFAASASTAKPTSRHLLQQRSGSCAAHASTQSFGHCAAYASTALCFLNLSLDFSLTRIALGAMIFVSHSQPLYLSLPAGLFGNIRTNKHVLRSCFGCRFLTQNLPPTFVSGLVPDLIFQCLA